MILGFIHVLGTELGQKILLKQLHTIYHTPLWKKTTAIYVGCVGNSVVIPKKYQKKIVYFHQDDPALYEGPTLRKMYEVVKEIDDCLVWYIHTKGASYQDATRGTPWRVAMEDIVIHEFEECIKVLKFANSCGAYGSFAPEPFYAGNFWWSKSSYIKTLRSPDDWAANVIGRGGSERYSYESWIVQDNFHRMFFFSPCYATHLPVSHIGPAPDAIQ